MNQDLDFAKPIYVSAASIIFLLLLGVWLGLTMGERFAPNSGLAVLGSVLMLPAALLLGMQLWRGFAIFMVLGHGRSLRLVRDGRERHPPDGGVPSGASAFVPVSVCFSGLTGLLAGILGIEGVFWALLCYLGVGLLYGGLCWCFARWGLL